MANLQGARQSQVLAGVMRDGMSLVVAGIAAGVVSAWRLARLMERLLFAVKPGDPAIFFTVTLTLLVTGCIACAIPSLRAARMDPIAALRHQ